MNVLMLHDYYQQRGGEDGAAEQDVAILRQRGHSVHFHTVHNEEIAEYGTFQKASLWFRPTWSMKSYREVQTLIKAFQPDIMHVHNFFPLLSPSVYHAARNLGVPVVQTLHNYRTLAPCALLMRENRVCERCMDGSLWNGIWYRCYRGSAVQTASVATMIATHRCLGTWNSMVERFIALTEFSRGVFVHGGLPTEKIVVRPNFVAEDPVLRPDERSGAIFVGRLSQEKGIECLLEAWRSLPETPLTVVGDGPLRGWATDFVRANNMKQVTLVGTKPFADVLELLARTSFLVFPSLWYETFGRTIIEAFATGTPVLVSGIGAGASLVKNGVTGLHFEAGNPTDLAEKARQMVADPERPRLWGEAARGEYVRKYTGEAAYESLMRIYGDVMAGGR